MNLRKLLFVPALGLASLAVVACGDDGGTTKTTPGASTDILGRTKQPDSGVVAYGVRRHARSTREFTDDHCLSSFFRSVAMVGRCRAERRGDRLRTRTEHHWAITQRTEARGASPSHARVYSNSLRKTRMELEAVLQQRSREAPVLVRADKVMKLERFVGIVDRVRSMGFQHVSLEVVRT